MVDVRDTKEIESENRNEDKELQNGNKEQNTDNNNQNVRRSARRAAFEARDKIYVQNLNDD